ncbi:MAG: hypothetical protein WCO06_07390 [Candidatus Roizmanbacteria bacterium]
MQHTFEFFVRLKDDRIINMNYVGKTCRVSKVAEKIAEDLKRMFGIEKSEIKEFRMKPESKIKKK